jgi:hypothetical protein
LSGPFESGAITGALGGPDQGRVGDPRFIVSGMGLGTAPDNRRAGSSIAATTALCISEVNDLVEAADGFHLSAPVTGGAANELEISTGDTIGNGFHAGIDPNGPMRLTATHDGTRRPTWSPRVSIYTRTDVCAQFIRARPWIPKK